MFITEKHFFNTKHKTKKVKLTPQSRKLSVTFSLSLLTYKDGGYKSPFFFFFSKSGPYCDYFFHLVYLDYLSM